MSSTQIRFSTPTTDNDSQQQYRTMTGQQQRLRVRQLLLPPTATSITTNIHLPFLTYNYSTNNYATIWQHVWAETSVYRIDHNITRDGCKTTKWCHNPSIMVTKHFHYQTFFTETCIFNNTFSTSVQKLWTIYRYYERQDADADIINVTMKKGRREVCKNNECTCRLITSLYLHCTMNAYCLSLIPLHHWQIYDLYLAFPKNRFFLSMFYLFLVHYQNLIS